MMRAAGLMLTLAACCGCSGEPDWETIIDDRVQQEWMQPNQYEDAIAFLEGGGHYYNSGDSTAEPPLDQQHILPLLKRLQAEFHQQPYAIILDEPDFAWSIVMKLPPDAAARGRLDAFMIQEQERFPGMILEEWGNEWLTLDFLDETEARLLNDGQPQ